MLLIQSIEGLWAELDQREAYLGHNLYWKYVWLKPDAAICKLNSKLFAPGSGLWKFSFQSNCKHMYQGTQIAYLADELSGYRGIKFL